MLDKNSPLLRNEFWLSEAERTKIDLGTGFFELPKEKAIRLEQLEAISAISVLNNEEKDELQKLQAEQRKIDWKNQEIALETEHHYTQEEFDAAVKAAREQM